MTWFRVDDGFHASRKVDELEAHGDVTAAKAIALWTLAGSWCSARETDGEIPSARVRKLVPWSTKKATHALVSVGLWEPTENGFRFRSWSKYNPTRDELEMKRDREADKKRRQREHSHPRNHDTIGECPQGTTQGTPDGTTPGSPGSLPDPYPIPTQKHHPQTPAGHPAWTDAQSGERQVVVVHHSDPTPADSPERAALAFDDAHEAVHGRRLGLSAAGQRNLERCRAVKAWARGVDADRWPDVVREAAEAALRSGRVDGARDPWAVFAARPGEDWGTAPPMPAADRQALQDELDELRGKIRYESHPPQRALDRIAELKRLLGHDGPGKRSSAPRGGRSGGGQGGGRGSGSQGARRPRGASEPTRLGDVDLKLIGGGS